MFLFHSSISDTEKEAKNRSGEEWNVANNHEIGNLLQIGKIQKSSGSVFLYFPYFPVLNAHFKCIFCICVCSFRACVSCKHARTHHSVTSTTNIDATREKMRVYVLKMEETKIKYKILRERKSKA